MWDARFCLWDFSRTHLVKDIPFGKASLAPASSRICPLLATWTRWSWGWEHRDFGVEVGGPAR